MCLHIWVSFNFYTTATGVVINFCISDRKSKLNNIQWIILHTRMDYRRLRLCFNLALHVCLDYSETRIYLGTLYLEIIDLIILFSMLICLLIHCMTTWQIRLLFIFYRLGASVGFHWAAVHCRPAAVFLHLERLTGKKCKMPSNKVHVMKLLSLWGGWLEVELNNSLLVSFFICLN